MNWWELPYPINEAILFHHTPKKGALINRELVCVVHIADYYVWRILRKEPSSFDNDVFAMLDISQEQCNKLLEKYRTEVSYEGKYGFVCR